MKHAFATFVFTLALSTITLSVAYAQGKSADSNGHGGGSVSTAGVGASLSGSSSVSIAEPQAGQNVNLGNDAIRGYGQLGASQTTPIGESMFLQLYGGVDLDQQKSTDPAGALNGRVGLGWKY